MLSNVNKRVSEGRKTKSYAFRLEGNLISFRLEKGSNAEILMNDYLEKHPRRKGRITYIIDQIFRLAMKDRLPEDSKLTTNIKMGFWSSLKSEHGSDQKAMDEIFRRAIEGFMDLYHHGQAPMIFPSRIGEVQKIKRAIEPSQPIAMSVPTEKGSILMERERKIIMTETTRITASIEEIKRLFPAEYRDTLDFRDNEDFVSVRLPYYDKDKWNEMFRIVREHNGRYQGEPYYHFLIPKK